MKIDRVSALEREYAMQSLDGQFRSAGNYGFGIRLEREFAAKMGVRHAVAMVNGTATLHAALEAAGVRAGDEVIVPPLTMSSTAIAVLHANAVPVFADVRPDTFLIDADDAERRVTARTKAIIPVALFGLMPDMDAIMGVAGRHGLAVIEDDAQCFLGSHRGRLAGTIGHMSSFSFQASKHMTSGEGGMVTTDDDGLALKLRRYSGLGYGSIGLGKARITKDDIQDPGCERHVVLGWNYRMPDIACAVACAQLERLDELCACRRLAGEAIAGAAKAAVWLVPQRVPPECGHAWWSAVFALDRDDVAWRDFRRKFMELGGDGIYAAWQLTYLEPAFREMNLLGREEWAKRAGARWERGLCPVAERLQPRLLQFKTNYWDTERAERQADILAKTIAFFA
ncbi:MAG: DegT/DnrJ/EryC1/StrS family aminotransferase [Clostridiales bacterium]|nr:DegT/DnrJ/EryC1/StrS family aminotransferase [Clostridiales bacterium]